MRGAPRGAWLRTRASELLPLRRLRACRADWAALNHRLALAGVARQCHRHHMKVMIRTVSNAREIRYWLSRQRADVLVTDRPALAVAIRGRRKAEHARSGP
jgi:glycerophosphoryl diester phosphodiesterase